MDERLVWGFSDSGLREELGIRRKIIRFRKIQKGKTYKAVPSEELEVPFLRER